MITIVLILLIVTVFFSSRSAKKNPNGFGEFITVGALVIGFFVFIAWISSITYIANNNYVNGQLAMYTESNISIEHNLKNILKGYIAQNPNKNLYLEEDEEEGNGYYITLVSTIPTLSSQDVVKQYISDYNDNKNNITELKKKSSELSSHKWLLYFGK